MISSQTQPLKVGNIIPITFHDIGKVLNVDGVPSLVANVDGLAMVVRRKPLAEGGGLEAVGFEHKGQNTGAPLGVAGFTEDGTPLYRSGIRMPVGPMLPVYVPSDLYTSVDEQLRQVNL